MIRSFRHRGLKRLYLRGDTSGVSAQQLERIEDILAHLDAACRPSDLDLPGFRLHALRGDLQGFWSVTVKANRRIIFRMDDGDVFDVDLTDYH